MTVDKDRFDSLLDGTDEASGSTGDCGLQIFGGESLDHDDVRCIFACRIPTPGVVVEGLGEGSRVLSLAFC